MFGTDEMYDTLRRGPAAIDQYADAVERAGIISEKSADDADRLNTSFENLSVTNSRSRRSPPQMDDG